MPPTRREKEFKRLNEMPWGELQKLAKEKRVKARKKDDIIEDILRTMKLPPSSGKAEPSTRVEDALAEESEGAAEVAAELRASARGKGKRQREEPEFARTLDESHSRISKKIKGKGRQTLALKEEEIDELAEPEEEEDTEHSHKRASSRKVAAKGRGKGTRSKPMSKPKSPESHGTSRKTTSPKPVDTDTVDEPAPIDDDEQGSPSRAPASRRSAAPEPQLPRAGASTVTPELNIPPVPTLPSTPPEPTIGTVISAFRQTLSVLNTMRSALASQEAVILKLKNEVAELGGTVFELTTDMDQAKVQLPELDKGLGEVTQSIQKLGGSAVDGEDALVKAKEVRDLEARFEASNARLESWEGQVNRLIDADLLEKLEDLGHQVESGSAGGNAPGVEDWRKKVEALEKRVVELEKTPIVPAPWTGNLLAQGRLRDALPPTPEPEKDNAVEAGGEYEERSEDAVEEKGTSGRDKGKGKEKETYDGQDVTTKSVERIYKEYSAPEVHRKVISTQSNVITVSTTTVMGGKFQHSYL